MEAEEGPDPSSVDQNTIVRATSGPESITTLADALGMPTGARGHGHLGGLLSGRLGDNRYEVRMCPRAARSGAPLRMILEYTCFGRNSGSPDWLCPGRSQQVP